MQKSATNQTPERLLGSLWHKDEVALFFGPVSSNKTRFINQVSKGLNNGESTIPDILTNDCPGQDILFIEFHISDKPSIAIAEFEKIVKSLVVKHKPDLIIIDTGSLNDTLILTQIIKTLIVFRKRYKTSSLITIDIPEKEKYHPLISPKILGSAFWFCDSIFGMRSSVKDQKIIYLKQFKGINEMGKKVMTLELSSFYDRNFHEHHLYTYLNHCDEKEHLKR